MLQSEICYNCEKIINSLDLEAKSRDSKTKTLNKFIARSFHYILRTIYKLFFAYIPFPTYIYPFFFFTTTLLFLTRELHSRR